MFAVVKVSKRTSRITTFSRHRTRENAYKALGKLRLATGIKGLEVRWCHPSGSFRHT